MTGIEQRVVNRFLEVTAAKGVSRVHSEDPLTEEALQWLIEEREKVIARYAAFIPDKLWKEELSALKKILQAPVDDPYDAAFSIQNSIIPFFDLFTTRLKNTGMNHHAVVSAKDRIDTLKKVLEDRAVGFDALGKEMETPYPIQALEDDLGLSIVVELKEYFKDRIPTVGKALNAPWVIPPGSVRKLSERLLTKATPEERKAIQLSVDENYDHNYGMIKFQFHNRVNLKGLALRLITKTKSPIDLAKVFERVKDVLESNYTQENLRGFDDFSIGDLKVIVLNPDIWIGESHEYAKRIIEARAILNRKGFGKLWYGVLFIVDNKFEKLAPDALEAYRKLGYETLESRAGTYHSGADVVRIMAPSNDSYLVDYIVHEMGHRYWYKFMKSDQRARFNDLVKTNPSEKIRDFPSGPTDEGGKEKPVTPVSTYGASTIEEAFAEVFEHYCTEEEINRDQLESFRSVLSSTQPLCEDALRTMSDEDRALVAKVARKFQGTDRGQLWVNVWDDSPPYAIIEVDFDRTPQPFDTTVRVAFLHWLRAQTEQAGFKTLVRPARTDNWSSVPADKNRVVPANTPLAEVRYSHIEQAFLVENPKWPGFNDCDPWNEDDHFKFLEQLQELYKSLEHWMGIPLSVTSES